MASPSILLSPASFSPKYSPPHAALIFFENMKIMLSGCVKVKKESFIFVTSNFFKDKLLYLHHCHFK